MHDKFNRLICPICKRVLIYAEGGVYYCPVHGEDPVLLNKQVK